MLLTTEPSCLQPVPFSFSSLVGCQFSQAPLYVSDTESSGSSYRRDTNVVNKHIRACDECSEESNKKMMVAQWGEDE